MNKKTLIIFISILALALIVTAVILLSPSKKQEQLHFEGVKIDANGNILSTCAINWNNTYKDGPLSDRAYYQMHAVVEGYYDLPYALSNGEALTISSSNGWDFDLIGGSVFMPSVNRYCGVQYILAHDQSWCVLIINDPTEGIVYFIGTADPSLSPTTIYKDYYLYFFKE